MGYTTTTMTIYSLGERIRLLQSKDDNSLVGVHDEFLELIDLRKLDYDIEGDPTGPSIKNGWCYFENATTKIILRTHTFRDEHIKELLGVLEITADFHRKGEVEL